ncbi:MAG: DUF2840 domain-containing protein [Burkholderiales bacterium]|nr:DUF2840 domain-containing protein [Burkholderiales bacterium]
MNALTCAALARAPATWPTSAMHQHPPPTRVSLAFVEHRVNIWLRFGKPSRETVLDRWRRTAVFDPGSVCCRVKWLGNDFGTAMWQLMVLQAPAGGAPIQRIGGVLPGAHLLLRTDGESGVKSVLRLIDNMEASGIDPCTAALAYWSTLGNRLASRQPLPVYDIARHTAHLAREALR